MSSGSKGVSEYVTGIQLDDIPTEAIRTVLIRYGIRGASELLDELIRRERVLIGSAQMREHEKGKPPYHMSQECVAGRNCHVRKIISLADSEVVP